MLIEFTVGNYRSFKDKVTFSMVASNAVALDKKLDENNVFAVDKDLKLLKSAAIYGANASGKSNLAKALSFIKYFTVNSSRETQSTDKIYTESFRLSTETEGKPSFFELVFLMNGIKHRYGFEVTKDRVISEWLFYVPKKRETNLFNRSSTSFSTSKKFGGEEIKRLTRENALFLSVSAQFNIHIAESILTWLTTELNVLSGIEDTGHQGYTVMCLLGDLGNTYKDKSLDLIKSLDLGIVNVQVKRPEVLHQLPVGMAPTEAFKIAMGSTQDKTLSFETLHKKFDSNGHSISIEIFDINTHESEGTQKIIGLSAPIIDTLTLGKTLIIDEFDARLHPLISRKIVELFNSNETNPNNAQLIFMTHDTNLLSNKLFRRDQIWFTEKDRYGATDLYSLVEYKIPDDNSKIRNDASFESDYIKGRYGGIPYIGNLESLINSND